MHLTSQLQVSTQTKQSGDLEHPKSLLDPGGNNSQEDPKTRSISAVTGRQAAEFAGNGRKFQQVAVQGRSLWQRLWLSLASLASLSLTGLEDPPRVKVTGSSATRLALGMPHSPVDQCPGVKRRSGLLGRGRGGGNRAR